MYITNLCFLCLQLKNKRGRGKGESVVDGVVADTQVFTEELHVGITYYSCYSLLFIKMLSLSCIYQSCFLMV